ncbi:MAG: hypothetical protein AAF108_02255 [Planctomycetota bacterium]
MSRFVFQYEAVLRVRRHEERQKQRRLAELERERGGMEERLRAIRRDLLGDRVTVREVAAGGSVDVSALRSKAASAVRSRAEAERTAIALAGVLRRIGAARSELLNAATARRSLELLRERRAEEHKRAELKRELAEIDDLVSVRASGGRSSGDGPSSDGTPWLGAGGVEEAA